MKYNMCSELGRQMFDTLQLVVDARHGRSPMLFESAAAHDKLKRIEHLQTIRVFHLPRRNTAALTTASVEKAMVIA